MKQLYIAKIEYINIDMEEKVAYAILPANDYSEAAMIIEDEWGKDEVSGLELHCVADDKETSAICISETMADAFIHDMPTEVYCLESEWRRKHRKEG